MRAIVIGSGVGGLSAAIRLPAMGLEVLVLEKLEGPGGRARVHRAEGFTFDMGPTVITVPGFLEDLFATRPGDPRLYPDFPQEEGLRHTERYVKLVSLDPFYRIYFPDGTHFDYNNDRELSERYEGLLQDIFGRKVLPEDFAHYLHLPTLTDPSLAPPGHHAAYTLVPVPHNGSGLDWRELGPKYLEKTLSYLDEVGYLPGLMDRLAYTHFITPDYFQWTLNSHLGNAFGPEPVLWQTASLIAHDLGLEKAPRALVEARG